MYCREKGAADGNTIALPPTQIIKGNDIFDYRSKYLPGLSRKITPIPVAEKEIENIRKACSELYSFFRFNVYARIDGFVILITKSSSTTPIQRRA